MWEKAFDLMLSRLLRQGDLTVTLPSGAMRHFGDGSGASVHVRIHDLPTLKRLVLNPELALGESYMNGVLTIEGGDLQTLIAMIVSNRDDAPRVWWQRVLPQLRIALRRFSQQNPVTRSRRNVAHHYDLSDELYALFLDEDRQYSCAYFHSPDDTLEDAQRQKKHHIARKLMIEPGMRVLDIGCGWGGMARTLARDHGAEVLGITLSERQHAYAVKRAEAEGLSDKITYQLCDYRKVEGRFDRIVSVGMFEHVGLPHYDRYFNAVRDLLKDDGLALIHTIGWTARPDATNPWIAKYIFPGGYIPTVSEVMRSVERSSLWVSDIEPWRLHYALTLDHWIQRFEAHRDEIAALYDDRFIRMWRFYLVASAETFRHGRQAVFQFQLSRKMGTAPLTRDYIYAAKS